MFVSPIILIICCLIGLIVHYVYPFFRRRQQLLKDYRNISPLPLSSIPLIGNLHRFDKRRPVFFRLLCQLSKQCQDEGSGLFCVWFSIAPRIFICSGEGIESLLHSNKHNVKSWSYTFMHPWLRTGLLTSNHEKWRSRRRLITPSFHDTRLLHSFLLTFNEQSLILVRQLNQCAEQRKTPYDLFPYISACTLDIIAETATGTHPNAQQSVGKNDFVEATEQMTDTLNIRVRYPWLWPKFVFDRSSTGKRQKQTLEILHNFSRKVIEERLATFNVNEDFNEEKKSKRRLAFLDSLITQMQAEQLSLDDIQEEVDTFMFAGHDTTATGINFCCYLLATHPDIQAKVHAELDEVFGDDQERSCTIEDIERMTYFDCVIKESLRLLPSVGHVAREAQEDFIYRGQTIRKGTTVAIFIYGIHHDAHIFPDPDKFQPERFADEKLISDTRSPFTYIPFSAGARNCIGQRFAGLEERVVLSTLFRRFTFQCSQTIDELDLVSEGILRAKTPIKISIQHRSTKT